MSFPYSSFLHTHHPPTPALIFSPALRTRSTKTTSPAGFRPFLNPSRNDKMHHAFHTSDDDQNVEFSSIWGRLPDDVHAQILAHLPVPDVLRCRLASRNWNRTITSQAFLKLRQQVPRDPEKPWLFVCSSFNCRDNCCAYNPNLNVWYTIPLTFLPLNMRFPLVAVGGFLFIRNVNSGHLAVCNPVTKTWQALPPMVHGRLNSLIGAFEDPGTRSFKVIVAGGTSECGGDYECTTEVYDSVTNRWHITGTVPRDYTVKITVWTSKTVFCHGILYCLTAARPYNIMAYDMKTGLWEEVKIPQPGILYCSFLIQRRGHLLLVGGAGCEGFCQGIHIWELETAEHHHGNSGLSEKRKWIEIERMPEHHFRRLLFQRFFRRKTDYDLKCAGCTDVLFFFKDSQSEMLMCDLSTSPTDWRWLPVCPLSSKFLKFSVRGLFVKPRLDAPTLGRMREFVNV